MLEKNDKMLMKNWRDKVFYTKHPVQQVAEHCFDGAPKCDTIATSSPYSLFQAFRASIKFSVTGNN